MSNSMKCSPSCAFYEYLVLHLSWKIFLPYPPKNFIPRKKGRSKRTPHQVTQLNFSTSHKNQSFFLSFFQLIIKRTLNFLFRSKSQTFITQLRFNKGSKKQHIHPGLRNTNQINKNPSPKSEEIKANCPKYQDIKSNLS